MKILIGMSGGIDSTVAAMLLKEQGHELVGATFRTFDVEDTTCAEQGCGSEDSVVQAQEMAARLGIEHHILDFRHSFRENVMQNFIDEYMRGRTPNPCVMCNSTIKWGMLLRKADELGCEKIATGHYARIVCHEGHFYLAVAADVQKDQTYFLWKLTEENLSRTVFPLGDFTKPQVRQMAAERGFVKLSQKTESQDICFLPDGNYRDFLSRNVADFSSRCFPGDFLDMQGKPVGRHEGFPNYTIGQRKGLKVAFGTPRYVTAIDAGKNTVTLGERDDLLRNTVNAEQCAFTDVEALKRNPQVLARIRYRSSAAEASIEISGNTCLLTFAEPVWGVTPGQSLVLYQNGRVVGGGTIF